VISVARVVAIGFAAGAAVHAAGLALTLFGVDLTDWRIQPGVMP